MSLLIEISGLIAGSVMLFFGADFLVRGGSAIAKRLGVSSLIIGLLLVAPATSAPEFVVSLSASLSGDSGISLGNIVGSNICNIALILGLCALVTPLRVAQSLIRFDAPVMLVSALMLFVCFEFTHGVPRWAGAVFFLCLIAYTAWNIRCAKKEERQNAALMAEYDREFSPSEKNVKRIPLQIVLLISGLAFLIFGAKAFLYGAEALAYRIGLSEAIVGLTVVAIGTSLPELATSVVAACRGERDIAVGNVVGSNIFNIIGILGIVPLISPIEHAPLSLLDMLMMMLCTIVVLPMMKSDFTLSRKEGGVLLFLYVAYTAALIYMMPPQDSTSAVPASVPPADSVGPDSALTADSPVSAPLR